MGSILLPEASLRITMGMLVMGSIISPRIFISTSTCEPPWLATSNVYTGGTKPQLLLAGLSRLCGLRQKFPDVFPSGLRYSSSAHHSRQLFDSCRSGQWLHMRDGPTIENQFLDAVLMTCECSDLRQMRHAKYLVPRCKFLKLLSHSFGSLSPNARIDFIEHQGLLSPIDDHDRTQRQHDARQLASGRDFVQWAGLFARVSGNSKFCPIYTP